MLQVQPIVSSFRKIIEYTLITSYPYPIFEQVPFEGRVGLFVLSAVVMALSTATLKHLYGQVNGYGTGNSAQAYPGDIKRNGVNHQ